MILNVSNPMDAWLRAEAAKLGISVSELVRRILDIERLSPKASST